MPDCGNQVLILGAASSFIGEAIELAEECGLRIAALITNIPLPSEQPIRWSYPLYELASLPSEMRALPAVCILTTPAYRKILVDEALKLGVCHYGLLVHPTAAVAKSAFIGLGSFVNTRAIIASNTILGSHVLVNRGASIGHDCVLDDFCTLGPGVTTGAFVHVHSGAFLGVGSVILPSLTIGCNAVVAGGAVVTQDVPDSTLVAGIPAVIKKENMIGYRRR